MTVIYKIGTWDEKEEKDRNKETNIEIKHIN
jgi:hypothetical protein